MRVVQYTIHFFRPSSTFSFLVSRLSRQSKWVSSTPPIHVLCIPKFFTRVQLTRARPGACESATQSKIQNFQNFPIFRILADHACVRGLVVVSVFANYTSIWTVLGFWHHKHKHITQCNMRPCNAAFASFCDQVLEVCPDFAHPADLIRACFVSVYQKLKTNLTQNSHLPSFFHCGYRTLVYSSSLSVIHMDSLLGALCSSHTPAFKTMLLQSSLLKNSKLFTKKFLTLFSVFS